jgi:hypothetical protein
MKSRCELLRLSRLVWQGPLEFDTMMSIRPTASAYARVAYARELQGNVHGALQAMQMAAEATTAHDPNASINSPRIWRARPSRKPK